MLNATTAESNPRFDPANYPVRDLDGFKPRRSTTFVLCRQASFGRRAHSRLSSLYPAKATCFSATAFVVSLFDSLSFIEILRQVAPSRLARKPSRSYPNDGKPQALQFIYR